MTLVSRARPHVSMETEDSTPETGNDRTDALTDEWPPLKDESDERVAEAIVDAKDEMREVGLRLDHALMNDGERIQGEDVEALLELGNDLRGLAANLACRLE